MIQFYQTSYRDLAEKVNKLHRAAVWNDADSIYVFAFLGEPNKRIKKMFAARGII